MSLSATPVAPRAHEIAAVKESRRRARAAGDRHSLETLAVPVAASLCGAAGLRAGERVLDVACGTGNAALAAARCGCATTGLDAVPSLLERARARAAIEGLALELVEGDPEAMPFGDGTFDAVVSVTGMTSAPDQERATAELLRTCRPGGTIALASWTPDGLMGDLLRLLDEREESPAGLRPSGDWGHETRVRELLAGTSEIRCRRRTFAFRFRSAEGLADLLLTRHGPTATLVESLDDAGAAAFRDEVHALVRRWDDETPAGVTASSDLLEVVARR